MIVQVVVEDGLQEIVDLPGSKLAIDTAVLRVLQTLKEQHYEKQSRNAVLSRGFIGTQKV